MNFSPEQVSTGVHEEAIRTALARQWLLPDLLQVTKVHTTEEQRLTFRIETSSGCYGLKVQPPNYEQALVEKDVTILRFLKNSGYHTTTLVETLSQAGYGFVEERLSYLYEWLEGETPASTIDTFEKLGAKTGLLHTLSEQYSSASNFSSADVRRLACAEALGKGIDLVYIELFQSLSDFMGLPHALIHTDIGPHHALTSPNGEIALIDWEDAGLGPMILDLGWPLEQCLTNASVFDDEKAKGFLSEYQKHRILTSIEREHLYEATLFFALLYWLSGSGQQEFERKRLEWFIQNKEEFQRILT